MSKYTTQVRFICESLSGLNESVGGATVNDVITSAIPKIFNFNFPIFDSNYRNVLCEKILRHYYTREIGAETVGLWKLWLETKLNEIMPYYNKLYQSELLDFNPFYEVDYTKTGNRENNGTKESSGSETDERVSATDVTSQTVGSVTSETTTNSKDKYSDTPQGSLSDLESNTYLTNARIVDTANDGNVDNTENTTSTTGTSGRNTKEYNSSDTINNMDEYTEHITGKMGGNSYSKLLKEFRETFLNIDVMIINDLSDLFLNIY